MIKETVLLIFAGAIVV